MIIHCFMFNADYRVEQSVFFVFDEIGQWWSGCPVCAAHDRRNINMIDPRYVLENETPALLSASVAST